MKVLRNPKGFGHDLEAGLTLALKQTHWVRRSWRSPSAIATWLAGDLRPHHRNLTSTGTPSMGRRRKQDKHLPQRVYLVHGSYWFRSKDGQPVNLGRDLADALARYARLIDGQWVGRTLGDVIDRYRTEVLPLKRSATTRADQAKQLVRLKQAFGIMLPDNVTARHCYAYQDGRRGEDGRRVPVTARHEISLLGHVFAKAIRWGVASQNPARGLELP